MTKSLREIEASLKLADVVLYVLDARAPYSCINPAFDALVEFKPVIYVLNKADLAPEASVTVWKERLLGKITNYKLQITNSDGQGDGPIGQGGQGGQGDGPIDHDKNEKRKRMAVALDGTASGSAKKILPLIKELARAKIEKCAKKGVNASLRGMVIGVPNSGKSTLINNFCGSAKTITGNKPGVTRGKQWVRVNEYFELLDTPGTLYPKLSDQTVARKLAYIGSVKDEVVDTFALACAFIEDMQKIAPEALQTRYGITQSSPPPCVIPLKIMSSIAASRGFLLRGGEADVERAASAVLDDFRKGRLGKICLDNPVDN
ncbi:MAG: ribosome biogenesis GTPase YlqF [Firmicutes bacterium]|nr:ribosome biogenesis GTPase YlqF [Bacillota bacterium]